MIVNFSFKFKLVFHVINYNHLNLSFGRVFSPYYAGTQRPSILCRRNSLLSTNPLPVTKLTSSVLTSEYETYFMSIQNTSTRTW